MQGVDAATEVAVPSATGRAADRQRLAIDLFDTLREISFDGVGISRETYGPGETAAMEIIERQAQDRGLETSWDAARNLIVRLVGSDPTLPIVATGSHLDTILRAAISTARPASSPVSWGCSAQRSAGNRSDPWSCTFCEARKVPGMAVRAISARARCSGN